MGISVAGFIAVAVAYMSEEFTPKALMVAGLGARIVLIP